MSFKPKCFLGREKSGARVVELLRPGYYQILCRCGALFGANSESLSNRLRREDAKLQCSSCLSQSRRQYGAMSSTVAPPR